MEDVDYLSRRVAQCISVAREEYNLPRLAGLICASAAQSKSTLALALALALVVTASVCDARA